MDNESEVIRLQMEQTRSSLQDKLETLEKQVTDTVQGAADAATETVQSVKDAVQETVDSVKDTVEGTVDSVRESLDINQHVRTHPWAMFLGATALGYIGTRLLSGNAGPVPGAALAPVPTMPATSGGVTSPPMPVPSNGRHGQAKPEKNFAQAGAASAEPSLLGRVADHYSAELGKLQGLAIGALGAVVREMLTSSAAPSVAQQITDIVDGFTEKLGGKPVRGPLFQKDDSPMKNHTTDFGHEVPLGSTGAPMPSRGGVNLG